MTVSMLSWSAPFLAIGVSFLFFRFLPLRKIRYCSYALVLVVALVLNLLHLSFSNGMLDTAFILAINFILAEFFWNLLRLKMRKLFLPLLIVALGLYVLEFREWIAAGPEQGRELWKDTIASSYRTAGILGMKSVLYRLKERTLYDHCWKLVKNPVASPGRADTVIYELKLRGLFDGKQKKNLGFPRLLILSKQIGSWPFEREISSNVTPQGFEETDFIYSWSTTPQGARLDLHVPGWGPQIWTMGEGF